MKKTNQALALILVSISVFFKLSFVFGSHKFFFSGISIAGPLVGAFFSAPTSAFLVSFYFLFKYFCFGKVLTFGLPTAIAACCWNTSLKRNFSNTFLYDVSNFLLRLLLPVFCMVVFAFHPVGKNAIPYTFYWTIPISIYVIEKLKYHKGVFSIAVSSTFLSHAVGSVIWIYSVQTTPEMWISLIPIVAIERLTFASGMAIGYFSINKTVRSGLIVYNFVQEKVCCFKLRV